MAWFKDRYENLKDFGQTRTWRWIRNIALVAILVTAVWFLVRNLNLNLPDLRAWVNNNRAAAAEQAPAEVEVENDDDVDDDAQVVLIASLQEELASLQEQIEALTEQLSEQEEQEYNGASQPEPVEIDFSDPLVMSGDSVDFSNPVDTPEDFPEDWANMDPSERESWMESYVGIPVKEIWVKDGLGGFGYAMNAKSVAVANGVCAEGVNCALHHTGEDTWITYSRGHGEPFEVTDATFTLEFGLTDEGGTCTGYWNQYVFDMSHGNYPWPLGEVAKNCLPIPQKYQDLVNPELGEKTLFMQDITGLPVNSVGHIADGFGLFWVYSGDLGEVNAMCPSDYACVYSVDGQAWNWVDGNNQELLESQSGIGFIDLSVFEDKCAAKEDLTDLLGDIAGAPTCNQ